MANPIPPIPLKIQVTDSDGRMGQAWSKFMIELFNRAGGTQSLSNAQIAELIEEMQTEIDTINASVSDYLNKGPVL